MKRTILLIDDKEEFLGALVTELKKRVGEDAEIQSWVPRKSDVPVETFNKLLDGSDVQLVVTDYDLTEQGQLGFFGATVVDWCQNRGIPVGDFSRGHASSLATEPNLFELRVPVESNEAAADYVATVYRGFTAIRDAIDNSDTLLQQRSPAAALAVMLGAKGMESQFSQYGIRYGGANSSLIDRFAETAPEDIKPEPKKKTALLSYIMGHLLLNSVLRFPGPIMSKAALAAYLAVDPSEHDKYSPLFKKALYLGPFAGLDSYYWTNLVDEVLGQFDDKVPEESEFESTGEQNRTLVEIALEGVKLTRSPLCPRCEGKNGGFLCPFTGRAVCQRPDCSVVSNVWIPAGARLSRFERGFYDEWAPILGM
jgi:hypothetical protein